jgi:hypothetical protein
MRHALVMPLPIFAQPPETTFINDDPFARAKDKPHVLVETF